VVRAYAREYRKQPIERNAIGGRDRLMNAASLDSHGDQLHGASRKTTCARGVAVDIPPEPVPGKRQPVL